MKAARSGDSRFGPLVCRDLRDCSNESQIVQPSTRRHDAGFLEPRAHGYDA
jgi:hypothetical protein